MYFSHKNQNWCLVAVIAETCKRGLIVLTYVIDIFEREAGVRTAEKTKNLPGLILQRIKNTYDTDPGSERSLVTCKTKNTTI